MRPEAPEAAFALAFLLSAAFGAMLCLKAAACTAISAASFSLAAIAAACSALYRSCHRRICILTKLSPLRSSSGIGEADRASYASKHQAAKERVALETNLPLQRLGSPPPPAAAKRTNLRRQEVPGEGFKGSFLSGFLSGWHLSAACTHARAKWAQALRYACLIPVWLAPTAAWNMQHVEQRIMNRFIWEAGSQNGEVALHS